MIIPDLNIHNINKVLKLEENYMQKNLTKEKLILK